MKFPSLKAIETLLLDLKPHIGDDYRASDDDHLPSMCVTIGADENGGWSYQTGDNSYSGGAYHYPHWAVLSLYRRSNCNDLAKDAIRQLWDCVQYKIDS